MSKNKADRFLPENEIINTRKETESPSGKYSVLISNFKTGAGTWSYTQGIVYRKGIENPIAVIQRNYSSFPYQWIENHSSGKDYFICGSDYQGQTVIELGSGLRRDELSEGADKGYGFCWVDYKYNPENNILIVDGCFWGGPYEYKFFDLSDPINNGWKEIKFEDKEEGLYSYDGGWPIFEDDGRIRFIEMYDPDDEEETREISSIRTFRITGDKLSLVDNWASSAQLQREEQRKEWERKDREWKKEFRATDPLYIVYDKSLKDPIFSPSDYESIGVIYDGWCKDYPRSKKMESRWCRRLIDKSDSNPFTIDIEWGVVAGPIKLQIFKFGKTYKDIFFEHSAKGMEEAFSYAKDILLLKKE